MPEIDGLQVEYVSEADLLRAKLRQVAENSRTWQAEHERLRVKVERVRCVAKELRKTQPAIAVLIEGAIER